MTLHPENRTNATGQTIELMCDVFGIDTDIDDDLVYQWIKSDPLGQLGWRSLLQPVVLNGSNVLPITNASVNDNGVYNCVVFSIDNNSTAVKSNLASITILGTYVCYISYGVHTAARDFSRKGKKFCQTSMMNWHLVSRHSTVSFLRILQMCPHLIYFLGKSLYNN